jgi:uncharacterized protein
MRYKILGKTGLKVSELGFGAIQITRIDEADAINLLKYAHSRGVNLIDTANGYFNSEEIIGKALKGIRQDMVIVTKSTNRDRQGFIHDLETSLKRLKTDYIDVYLFHYVVKDADIDTIINNGLLEALLNEKKKGKIGHIGFSCHSPKVLDRLFEIEDFATIMIPVNFLTTEYVEEEIYSRLIKNDIGMFAMKPFGGGRLDDIRLCFKFLNLYPELVTVAGMQSIEELDKNIEYVSSNDIPNEQDYKKINEISDRLGTKFCRQCGYCMPCEEKGIDIISVNFIEVNYKQFPKDEFLKRGLDKKVDAARECIECGKCSEKCPFELDVPSIIKHNIEFFDKLAKS